MAVKSPPTTESTPHALGAHRGEYADALREAIGYLPADAPITAVMRDLLHLLEGEPTLTVGETANFLGVRSPNTVKNWLQSGAFPAATRTPGGHWRFPLEDVLRVRAEVDHVRARNAVGDIRPARHPRAVWAADELA